MVSGFAVCRGIMRIVGPTGTPGSSLNRLSQLGSLTAKLLEFVVNLLTHAFRRKVVRGGLIYGEHRSCMVGATAK